jgi:hypothetical protein
MFLKVYVRVTSLNDSAEQCILFGSMRENCIYRAGLGNVRPAGHMRPANRLNVAREHFFKVDITFKKCL